MCKLYQNISKLTPITHQSNVDLWQKRMTKNTTQKQLRFLMPQTSGHTQVSQSQSSSSAHVPGQSQTLSFTNPRRSRGTMLQLCMPACLIFFAHVFTQKKLLHSLSLYPIQEPIGKEQLPGGGHWKRGSCARACTSVHLMKPPVRRAAILGLPESCPGAKKQRIPKKIDWTFPGFVFGIVLIMYISRFSGFQMPSNA